MARSATLTHAARRALIWALAAAALGLFAAACGDDGGDGTSANNGGTTDTNQPPTFSSLPSEVRVLTGESVELNVVAEDPEGEAVSLTMEEAPEGAQFLAPDGFGRFFWSPLASDAEPGGKSHDVVFAAEDASGGRATQRVVVIVEPTDGAPRFTTSNQRVLDLTRTSSLSTRITVKDDDSVNVTLSLEQGPSGMALNTLGPKEAELVWTPGEDQVRKRSVWTAEIKADDGAGGVATQQMSIILVSKRDCTDASAGTCGCAPPEIGHTPLGEQRGADDYTIEATITDAESAISNAVVFWTSGDPEDFDNYTSVQLEPTSGDTYRATLPNPGLAAGETADVFYLICAVDDDDPNGEDCDNLICNPEQGVYQFVAYPAGDASCRADVFEPNETPADAPLLAGEQVVVQEGITEAYGLTLCDGDSDVFRFENLEPYDGIAMLAVSAEDVSLTLRALADDGTTVLAESVTDPPGEHFITVPPLEAGGVAYIEVSGGPGAYALFSSIYNDGGPDCADVYEPNDTLADATDLEPTEDGDDLRICAEDLDLFRVPLGPGQTLTALIAFTHTDGDLDAAFLDPSTGDSIVRATSSDDDEIIELTNDTSAPIDAMLAVYGYEGATNAYGLLLERTGDNPNVCTADAAEPNDTPQTAADLEPGADAALTACADDDFYAINVGPHTRLWAALGFNTEAISLDLNLLSADGAETLQGGAPSADGETIVAALPDAGAYLLAVTLGVVGIEGPYQLAYDACSGDEAEPNDTLDQAELVVDGFLFDRNVCFGDVDLYSVPAAAGEAIVVDLEILTGSADGVTVTLHDGALSNPPIATATVGGNTFSLNEVAPSDGDYIVQVAASDSAKAEYDALISLE